jgi:quercetin dioxygenase-like cupin family protein
MWSRSARMLILVCLLATSGGLGQDPTKVEPTHYKHAFENEHVQVVYIHYGPHERSSLHEHPAGVVVNITEGHLRFTDEDGRTQELFARHGEARWFPPFKHAVENLGNTSYDGVYIAIKDGAGHLAKR